MHALAMLEASNPAIMQSGFSILSAFLNCNAGSTALRIMSTIKAIINLVATPTSKANHPEWADMLGARKIG